MGFDPFAWLTDFIADPCPADMPVARRMALKMTSRLPDAYEAAVFQDDLCERLDAVVTHWNGSVHDLFDRQQEAREVLLRIKRNGTQ